MPPTTTRPAPAALVDTACPICGGARDLEALLDPPGTPCWPCQRAGRQPPSPPPPPRKRGPGRPRRVPDDAPVGCKRCRTCLEVKPVGAFYYRQTHGTYRSECKVCHLGRAHLRYLANREAVLAATRERNATPEGRERRRAASRRNRKKARAATYEAVRRAVVRGAIARPATCSAQGCNAPAQHAHHVDYARRFDVTFLCVTHHGELHRKYDVDDRGRVFPRAPS